jgi:5-methylcytosine-specific restriction endonuclease McrA
MADNLLYPKLHPQTFPSESKAKWKNCVRRILPQICTQCGSITELTIHHKNHNSNDCRISNLEMVCRKCHNTIHIGGALYFIDPDAKAFAASFRGEKKAS